MTPAPLTRSRRKIDTELLAVADRLFVELGLATPTMDLVAQRAGVSRATVYRRFGTRDQLLLEVFLKRVARFAREAREISERYATLAEQIEESYVSNVLNIPADPLLKHLLADGLANAKSLLASTRFRDMSRDIIGPLLERARLRGELRPGLEPEAVLDWLYQQLFGLVQAGPWTEPDLRTWIRTFMCPVLVRDNWNLPDDSIRTQLQRVELLLNRFEGQRPGESSEA